MEIAPAAAAPPLTFVRGGLTIQLYLIFGFFQFLLNIQGNILPFLQDEIGFSYRVAGLHPSGLAVGTLLIGMFGDRIVHQLGRRFVLLAGVAGMCVAGVGLCLAGSEYETIGSVFLMGLAGGSIVAISYSVLADVHGPTKNIAFNEINAVCYGFAIAAPLLTGLAISLGLGWRSAILLDVALGIVLLARLVSFDVPDAAPRQRTGKAERLPAAYWIYLSALACGVSLEFCALIWAPAYFERVVGLDGATAATAAATFPVAMFVGRSAGSWLIRRFPASKILPGAFVLQAVGFVLYFSSVGAILTIIGLFILGLGVSVLYPLIFGLAVEVAGSDTDRGTARSLIASSLAILVVPAALGALADSVGLHMAHLIMPVLTLATVGIYVAARSVQHRAAYSASSS
jgi:fucose permease